MCLEKVEERIQSCLRSFPVVQGAYLFGSVLDGEGARDIDVGLVVSDLDERDTLILETELAHSLSEVDGRPFDVTVLSRDRPLFAFPVLREGRLVYVPNHDEVTDFIVQVSRAYGELYPRYRKALDEILEEVRP